MLSKIKKYEILIMVTLAAAIGGGTGAFSKLGLESFSPVVFTFIRFILATLILLPIFLYKEKLKLSGQKTILFISLLAVANVTLFIFGVAHTTAIISQTLYAAIPLLSAIIAFIFYRERLTRKKELGLLIGFAGVLVIILLPVIGEKSLDNGSLLGNLLIFSAVVSVSLYFFLSKKLQENHTPLSLTTIFILLTVIIQALLLPLEGSDLSFSGVTWTGIISVLFVGILGTGLYYLLYQYAIKKATPLIASLSFYLQPIFGVIWAMILLGEKITPTFLVGALLALIGVYIVTNSKEKSVKTN